MSAQKEVFDLILKQTASNLGATADGLSALYAIKTTPQTWDYVDFGMSVAKVVFAGLAESCHVAVRVVPGLSCASLLRAIDKANESWDNRQELTPDVLMGLAENLTGTAIALAPFIPFLGPVAAPLELGLVSGSVALAIMGGHFGDQLKIAENRLFDDLGAMISSDRARFAWLNPADQTEFVRLQDNKNHLVPAIMLMHALDPNAGLSDLRQVVERSSSGNYLENSATLIQSMQKLLNGTLAGKAGDVYGLAAQTKAAYDALSAYFGTASVIPLATMSAAEISGVAANPDAYATRYALRELNSFAVVGVDYSIHNAGGRLELVNPETGTGDLSNEWLVDRAAMLAWKLKLNSEDYPSSIANPYHDDPNAYFKDFGSGEQIVVGNPPMGQMDRRFILFGSEAGEVLNGTSQQDRLYGMGGDDRIDGGGDADYLEGNGGSDQLSGGTGDDQLKGGSGHDTLIGGAGADTLIGGAGNDLYRADKADTLQDSGGQGQVFLGETKLGIALRRPGQPDYLDRWGNRYVLAGSELTVYAARGAAGSSGLRIEDFSNGDLGIVLLDQAQAADLGIDPKVNTPFLGGLDWFPVVDPLALDLDGDGLETTGIDVGNPVRFDHDGDGLRTGTGWVQGDDGFLALDRNGNGSIDNGSELFGVDTVLANGHKASSGFAALADQDSNGDGVFDAGDTAFAQVRLWQDANQDGIRQADELKGLAELGIVRIDLAASPTAIPLPGGNVLTARGRYWRADGSEGSVGEVLTGATGNLDLASNPFYREFTDTVPLTAAAEALPDLRGSGAVRDLREAASLDPVLVDDFNALSGTRRQMLAGLDTLLADWAATSNLETSRELAQARGTTLHFAVPGATANEMARIALQALPGITAAWLDSHYPVDAAHYAGIQAQVRHLDHWIPLLGSYADGPCNDRLGGGSGCTPAAYLGSHRICANGQEWRRAA